MGTISNTRSNHLWFWVRPLKVVKISKQCSRFLFRHLPEGPQKNASALLENHFILTKTQEEAIIHVLGDFRSPFLDWLLGYFGKKGAGDFDAEGSLHIHGRRLAWITGSAQHHTQEMESMVHNIAPRKDLPIATRLDQLKQVIVESTVIYSQALWRKNIQKRKYRAILKAAEIISRWWIDLNRKRNARMIQWEIREMKIQERRICAATIIWECWKKFRQRQIDARMAKMLADIDKALEETDDLDNLISSDYEPSGFEAKLEEYLGMNLDIPEILTAQEPDVS